MNTYVLLSISMLVCLFGSLIMKHLTNSFRLDNRCRFFINIILFVGCDITFLFMADINSISLFTVLLGLVFGFVTSMQRWVYLLALETGPLSYTSVITYLSTIIPAMSGVLFWNETLSKGKIIGMILIILCMLLSVETKESSSIKDKKWYLYCGLSFIAVGLIGVLQKIHQMSVYKDELDAFLIVAFFLASVLSLVMFLFSKRKGDEENLLKSSGLLSALPILLLVAASIFMALNNKFNLFLSGVMESAVFFPIVNGGGIVLALLSSIIIFKERITKKQWLGIALGTAAIIILCIA